MVIKCSIFVNVNEGLLKFSNVFLYFHILLQHFTMKETNTEQQIKDKLHFVSVDFGRYERSFTCLVSRVFDRGMVA